MAAAKRIEEEDMNILNLCLFHFCEKRERERARVAKGGQRADEPRHRARSWSGAAAAGVAS